jgi:hypothetical protein
MTKYLHVTNGDCTAETLSGAVPGEIAVWAEPLHEGPVPYSASPEEWRQVRAHHYAARGWGTVAENESRLASWDAALDRCTEFDEVVLWLEHDLFDQLLLIRHLNWLSRRNLGRTRVALICIGAFPGRPKFRGLGELTADELGSLFGTQRAVTPEQFDLGRRAWAAFGSTAPRLIEAVLAGPTFPLPFLDGALRRHLAEFPSRSNGLSRTESVALTRLAAGPECAAVLFETSIGAEDAPYMGDGIFFALLDDLAAGESRLIEAVGATGPQDPGAVTYRLTVLGRRVVQGTADRVRDAGIDRHLGGVHLRGRQVLWRWDEANDRLVSER